MIILIKALFWFLVAFALAAVEIEIEGKFGWAEKLPTWYRKSRAFGFLMQGKPLTGYHLFMGILLLLLVHSSFFLFINWSITLELQLLAMVFAVVPVWDFLWFVLNPNYGVRNFKQMKVWWFSGSQWIFDLFPSDYLIAWIISIILAALSGIFLMHLITLFILLDLAFAAIILSPFYHEWYKTIRKKDDRNKSGIFH